MGSIPNHRLGCRTYKRPVECLDCGSQVNAVGCSCGSYIQVEELGKPWPKHDCTDLLNDRIIKEKYSGSRLISKKRAYPRKNPKKLVRIKAIRSILGWDVAKTIRPKPGSFSITSAIVRAIGYDGDLARVTIVSTKTQKALRYVFLIKKSMLANTTIGMTVNVMLEGTNSFWRAKSLQNLDFVRTS